MNNNKKLAFIMMLDASGSMSRCFDMVKIDSKAFVREARAGDQFGINSFSDDAKWACPAGTDPRILTVSPDLHETQKATKYIEELKTFNMTNMGDAIRLANQMMEHSNITADLRAYILLSDGRHNYGATPPEAVLKDQPPIYIAALGDISDRYFNRLICKNQKSRIYNKPNAYQMMLMFNQILGDATDSALTLNSLNTYNPGSDYLLKTFQVCEADNETTLNVVWSNSSYKYTPMAPSYRQINIVLIDPDDKNTDIRPDIAENGYCIYHLNHIKPGTWKVLIQYSVDNTLTGTIGAIDFQASIRSDLLLPSTSKAGEPLEIGIAALDEGQPAENLQVKATVFKPRESVSALSDQYRDELEKLTGADSEVSSAPDGNPPAAPLNVLREKILSSEGRDILAKEVVHRELTLSKEGNYTCSLEDVQTDGIYNVEVEIQGISPQTGLPFTRLKSGVVFVE